MESIIGYLFPQSGGLQYPNANCDNDYAIQDALDAAGHRNVPVDEMQQDPDDDENEHDSYEWHKHLRGFAEHVSCR